MAKTVRLLALYKGYPRNSILTLPDSEADALLLGGISATLDLTGGVEAFQMSPDSGLSSGTNLPPNQTVTAGQMTDVVVPSGVTLGLSGTSDIAGNWSIVNPDGTTVNPAPLAAGQSTVGVFVVDTKVRFAVTFGTLTIKAGVVAGSVTSQPLYFVPIDPATGLPYKISGGGGGSGGEVTIPEGGDVTVGSRADPAATDPTATNSLMALTKLQAANQTAVLAPATAPGAAPAKASLVGGIFSSAQPLLTAGQAVGLQFDERGSVRMRLHGTNWAMTDGMANTNIVGMNGAADGTGGSRALGVTSMVYNGTTWDRVRGDVFGMRMQPAQRAGTNRSKAITTTSSEVIPANSNSWFLANDSTVDIFINIGAAASATPTSTDGSFKLRPGERLSSKYITETGAINAVVATGTADIKARST